MLVLPVCGFSPDQPCGAGSGNLLLPQHTDSIVALAVSVANAYHTTITLTQQKQILQMNAQLHALVERDPLKGLLNKITVECRTEQLLLDPEQMKRTGGLTMILLDLDEFKWINDRYGHPCGDHVLTQMAEAMREAFSEAACLGRIGGDEFAAVYARPLTETGAVALGEQLAASLKEIRWQDQPMEVRCSMGACICTLPGRTYRQLYEETDQMLYRAKKAGKGRCMVRQLDHAVQSRLEPV